MSFRTDPQSGLPVNDIAAGAVLRYGVDLSAVVPAGATITGASVTATGTVSAATARFSGTQVSALVTAGQAEGPGYVTISWTTTGDDAETDSRTLMFKVKKERW
jgi:hypothetical protein